MNVFCLEDTRWCNRKLLQKLLCNLTHSSPLFQQNKRLVLKHLCLNLWILLSRFPACFSFCKCRRRLNIYRIFRNHMALQLRICLIHKCQICLSPLNQILQHPCLFFCQNQLHLRIFPLEIIENLRKQKLTRHCRNPQHNASAPTAAQI